MKRLIDLLVSFLMIVVLSPLILCIAILMLIFQGRPIFFKQKRIGLDGIDFNIFKFRTMKPNSEIDGFSTLPGDARITMLGKYLRKCSLDEIPQLFNVLVGSMSLVGPRPDVEGQRSIYTDSEYKLRVSVKPGITGLAQATLRSEATIDERKRLDLQYCANNNIFLDIRILFLTVLQVFGRGGY